MKSRMFKKFLALSLVVLMLFTAIFATGCVKKDEGGDQDGEVSKLDGSVGRSEFINSIGGVSETYKGAVSKESYSTAEDAAKSFVTEEIVGSNTAVVSGVTLKRTLSETEASSLIPSEVGGAGIVEVQQHEVTYSVNDGKSSIKAESGYTNVDSFDTTRKIDVYIIKYENDWKYFSPMPVTNTTVTKSYYDSVFNSDRYSNCTFEVTTDMKMSVESGGQSESFDCTITQTMKFAGDKILLTQTVSGDTTQLGLSGANMQAYIEKADGSAKIYVKQGTSSSWVEGNLYQVGFTNIDDLAPFATAYFDYTYFNKTDYGFALTGENAKKYFTSVFNQMAGGIAGMLDQMNIDMYAEYYVQNGALSGCRTEANVNLEMNTQGVTAKLDESVKAVTTCTNYGTTVVTKPF